MERSGGGEVKHQTEAIQPQRRAENVSFLKSPCPEGSPCKLHTYRECNKMGQAVIGRQVAAKDNCLLFLARPVCHLPPSWHLRGRLKREIKKEARVVRNCFQ